MKSFSNLETLSLTHTVGISRGKTEKLELESKPHSTTPFFRTKSIAPKSAGKI